MRERGRTEKLTWALALTWALGLLQLLCVCVPYSYMVVVPSLVHMCTWLARGAAA